MASDIYIHKKYCSYSYIFLQTIDYNCVIKALELHMHTPSLQIISGKRKEQTRKNKNNNKTHKNTLTNVTDLEETGHSVVMVLLMTLIKKDISYYLSKHVKCRNCKKRI